MSLLGLQAERPEGRTPAAGGGVPVSGYLGQPAEGGRDKRKTKEGQGWRRKGEGSVGRTQPGGKGQQE